MGVKMKFIKALPMLFVVISCSTQAQQWFEKPFDTMTRHEKHTLLTTQDKSIVEGYSSACIARSTHFIMGISLECHFQHHADAILRKMSLSAYSNKAGFGQISNDPENKVSYFLDSSSDMPNRVFSVYYFQKPNDGFLYNKITAIHIEVKQVYANIPIQAPTAIKKMLKAKYGEPTMDLSLQGQGEINLRWDNDEVADIFFVHQANSTTRTGYVLKGYH